MLSVKAIFDGNKIKLFDKIEITEQQEVIITFLDTSIQGSTQEEIYKLAEYGGSFDFLKEPEEDIYSDTNLKVKYK